MCLFGLSKAAVAQQFAGDWVAWFCPANVKADPEKCSSFAVVLFEQRGRLCGSHSFATPRGARLDEGAAASIIGTTSKQTAAATIQSGRSGQQMRVQFRLSGDRVDWQRIDQPAGDHLLPVSARLQRAKRGSLFEESYVAEIEVACAAPLKPTIK